MINFRKIEELCIIDVPQDIFLKDNISKLKELINDVIEQGCLRIMLNMSEITKIDGASLGALLSIQRIALCNEVDIKLYSLQPYVAQILFQTRMNRIFDIFQTEDGSICEEALSDSILIS